jgi:toxin ParE1/3/4
LRDLAEISEYVGRDNQPAADRLVIRIMDQVDVLGDHPHIGRAGRVETTRELVVTGTPYIVAYTVSDEGVEVLAVLHGARRWPDSFG